MLVAVLVLLGCQLIGEAARDALALPVPGPVVGMFLLAIVLARRGTRPDAVPAALGAMADTLISHMGLLFVPAGVGIVAEAPLLDQQWVPILAALVGSTVLSLGVTGIVMHRVVRSRNRRSRDVATVGLELPSC